MKFEDLKTAELSDVFSLCNSPIYRVMDGHGEEATNPGDAKIKHLGGEFWVYVDDQDGYSVMTDSEIEGLDFVADKDGSWNNDEIFRVVN